MNATTARILVPGKFWLDDIFDTPVDGYMVKGEQWNGWHCPYFTADQAAVVVFGMTKLMNEHYPEESMRPHYDIDQDAYVFPNVDYPDEPDVYPAVVINGRAVYQIGGGGWVWDLDTGQ